MKNLNLTPRAQKLIKEAYTIALKNENIYISHMHLFIAFFNLKHSQIEEAFDNFSLDHEKITKIALEYLKKEFVEEKKTNSKPILSNKAKEIFKAAKYLSEKYDHKYIGLEHIFISMFEVLDEHFIKFTKANKIPLEKVVNFLEKNLEEEDMFSKTNVEEKEEIKSQTAFFDPKKYKVLNTYATNLNQQVINGKITNLHINKELIQKISEVLCRKNKNNPLIVGEAGVGKTALVESLAQAIVEGQASDLLLLKQIYSLDITMIVAGCKYRGEFEEKIKNLLKEIINDQFIILFIDEIHTIIGAGNPANGMDVANILKPYLARGDVSCIGATTFDEYKKTIADDPALSRRFQIIKLEEPTKDKVFSLVKNIKEGYENFHAIEFSDDIIKYIIDIADKYIEGRFPDKALDVLDQVGSKCKLKNFSKTPEMLKLEQKLKKAMEKQNELKDQRSLEKNGIVIDKMLMKFQILATKMVVKWKTNKYKTTKEDVLSVVSDKTNIPLEDLQKQDIDKVRLVKTVLETSVKNQIKAIEQIYKSLIRAKAGFRSANKPTCSFLFAGPTGVGKTMTAKLIAETLFINKNNFITLDMSEYSDKTAISKLIGSNPGYINHEKGGFLTEKVKKNTYSLILFDEIQKADPDILFLICQILEEGKITDSSGKTIDFTNTIIICTTNVGSEAATTNQIGFVKSSYPVKNDVLTKLKSYFSPDFLNRLDEIVMFNALDNKHIQEIINSELENLKLELKEKGIDASFDESIVPFINKKIQFDNFGARQAVKTIQRELQTLIAEKILENLEIKTLKITVQNDIISVT